ncbi:hypothetical protein G7Y89_g5964 [Cudoniella acicularis]|uniref:Ubiquitin-like domain-containing protein n=1 Tax=Cudoniella acicularis TaxID=354080 RepID=A0A8H4RMV4_9HELO|nr:hypothetical protein G7Y89_g5964 [Cudoniella acicularis]
MSFGWPAGDLATEITIVYNLVEALDSCDGAANDYREAVAFLQDLKRTLEPLQTFTAWNSHPAYGQEIGKQHFFVSKKALVLRGKINSNMRIIDSLMQRLTLDIVYTTQQSLPGGMRAALQEVLRPELIATLRESLPSINSASLEQYQEKQTRDHEVLVSRVSERYEWISSGIDAIKLQLQNSDSTQQRLERFIRGGNIMPEGKTPPLPALPENQYLDSSVSPKKHGSQSPNPQKEDSHSETLKDVSFSEEPFPLYVMSPPINSGVLQEFIKYEFRDLLESTWVNRGRYLLLSLANNDTLDERTWSTIVPGARVAMPMVVRKRLNLSSNPAIARCPEKSCSGSWTKGETKSWVICPVCHKEVLNSIFKNSKARHQRGSLIPTRRDSGQSKSMFRSKKARPKSNSSEWQETSTEAEIQVNEDDIAIFKRVIQEVIHFEAPATPLSDVSKPQAPVSPVTYSLPPTSIPDHYDKL